MLNTFHVTIFENKSSDNIKETTQITSNDSATSLSSIYLTLSVTDVEQPVEL